MSDTTPPTPEPASSPIPPAPPAPNAYAQPSAPAAPGYAPGVAPRTNTLAIVGFILAFFVSLAGIICGFIALGQIKRTGEGGRGLALAAVIIGFAGIVIGIIWVIAAVALAGAASYNYG